MQTSAAVLTVNSVVFSKWKVINVVKSIASDVTTPMTVQTGQTKRTAQHARPVSVMMMSSCVRSADVSLTRGNVTARQTARMVRTRLVVVSTSRFNHTL